MNLKTLKGVKVIFSAIIAIIIFIGGFIVAYPLYQQQAKFKVDQAAAISAQEDASTNFAKMKKYSEQVEDVKKINDEASKSFPLPKNISSYMTYYKGIAKDSGLNPSQLKITTTLPTLVTGSGTTGGGETTPPPADGATPVPGSGSEGTGDLASMSVDLTIPASPEQAKVFSQKLLSGERSFTIQSLTIGSTTEGTSDKSLNIKGTTYFHRTIDVPASKTEQTPSNNENEAPTSKP